MKAFSIAVAVTLVLAFVCIAQTSALPVLTERELEEGGGGSDTPVAAHQGMPIGSRMERLVRQKRHFSPTSICLWCTNCCQNKGWSYCCWS